MSGAEVKEFGCQVSGGLVMALRPTMTAATRRPRVIGPCFLMNFFMCDSVQLLRNRGSQ